MISQFFLFRRKLKKEIKLLESFGKKPKPVEEFIFDKKYEANINERIRPTAKVGFSPHQVC